MRWFWDTLYIKYEFTYKEWFRKYKKSSGSINSKYIKKNRINRGTVRKRERIVDIEIIIKKEINKFKKKGEKERRRQRGGEKERNINWS